MEKINFISKKIDNKNQFVFIKSSNKFLIFENLYIDLLNQFFSLSKNGFENYVLKNFPNSNPNNIYLELKELLLKSYLIPPKTEYCSEIPKNLQTFKFKLGEISFTINYDDIEVVNTVIGQLFHLHDNNIINPKNYYVFKTNDRYFLKNSNENLGSWKNDEIHFLTGKLLSLIMCDFHKVEEKKWAGFLHASTICKDNKAFIVIGESGDGKSTCSAVLCKHGYNLVADDITPINREGKVGNFPNSISIKTSSFNKIKDLYSHKKINYVTNTKKGKIRYLNPSGLINFTPNTLSCFDIVKIKYDEKKKNSIRQVKLKDILPIIINDSYFPSSVKSVKSLMNWLINCNYYNINYNNDSILVNFFEKIRN